MPPISVQHLTTKLEELKVEMDGGRLRHGEYDQRLARLIGTGGEAAGLTATGCKPSG